MPTTPTTPHLDQRSMSWPVYVGVAGANGSPHFVYSEHRNRKIGPLLGANSVLSIMGVTPRNNGIHFAERRWHLQPPNYGWLLLIKPTYFLYQNTVISACSLKPLRLPLPPVLSDSVPSGCLFRYLRCRWLNLASQTTPIQWRTVSEQTKASSCLFTQVRRCNDGNDVLAMHSTAVVYFQSRTWSYVMQSGQIGLNSSGFSWGFDVALLSRKHFEHH